MPLPWALEYPEAMAEEEPPRVLAILGGDGSVSRAAHLARRHDLTLLVLPNGTFNHLGVKHECNKEKTTVDRRLRIGMSAAVHNPPRRQARPV